MGVAFFALTYFALPIAAVGFVYLSLPAQSKSALKQLLNNL